MAKANPDSVFSFAGRLANRMNSLDITQGRIDDIMKNSNDAFWGKFDQAILNIDPGIAKFVEKANEDIMKNIALQLKGWSEFYKKFFGIDVRLPEDWKSIIPAHQSGFDRLILVARGVSINQVYEKGKENFFSWKWCDSDIESQMRVSERGEIKETYAIWVRDEQEVPKELLGKSAQDVENPANTENLLERLLHGFKYWSETKKHLDVNTWTLCAFSQYADGAVPLVGRLSDDYVNVGRGGVSGTHSSLGARRVVRVG